jgi:hypothetical protein
MPGGRMATPAVRVGGWSFRLHKGDSPLSLLQNCKSFQPEPLALSLKISTMKVLQLGCPPHPGWSTFLWIVFQVSRYAGTASSPGCIIVLPKVLPSF